MGGSKRSDAPAPETGRERADLRRGRNREIEGATVHGFRSSFRDWAAESGAPREAAEASLAHVVRGVEGSYLRTDFFERRRALMEAWARYIGNFCQQ